MKPAGYPIPIDGPTGDLLRAQGRHNMRPAHLHFLASKDGFKTLISQLYVQDDKFIDTDVQFGVTRHLIGNYVRHDDERRPQRMSTRRGTRWHTPSSWKQGPPSCRGRRSRARRAVRGPRSRISRSCANVHGTRMSCAGVSPR